MSKTLALSVDMNSRKVKVYLNVFLSVKFKNGFNFAVCLFSYRSQIMNKKVANEPQASWSLMFILTTFLRHL